MTGSKTSLAPSSNTESRVMLSAIPMHRETGRSRPVWRAQDRNRALL
jgi:hypothetical protein